MKNDIIKIGKKTVGFNSPVFIIAEAGVNHNGKLDLALKLIDVAATAGADAVKFQTFKAENVVLADAEMVEYQKKNLRQKKSQQTMLRELELREEFYEPIIKRCAEKNIIFFSTPHGGKQSVDFLETIGVGAYKIGSGDLTNYLLLNRVAKTKKPIILSTGMATLKEIQDSISFIRSKGNNKIVVLHCTTNYPCPLEEVNLKAMVEMIKKFSVPVGYSDHTLGNQTAIMAVTLGATLYECHFTLDKNLPGPDHAASADPRELKEKISAIREVQTIMGSKEKKPTKSELKMRKGVRKSIVFTRVMAKGTVIREDDLEAKRPANGVSPARYKEFVGKRLVCAVGVDRQLSPGDIE